VQTFPMSADGWASASRRTPSANRAPPRSGGRGGMDPKMAKQLQELQKENSRLKKLVADQALDMLILKEAACPN
jgi:hypothetical protein